ncbi:MAG TPA: mechanosensitive ion channel domain-containing protein [Verrucomicrobiae bacterium]|nr:mechanosensitive ion channel domain-containing protein [Verrucomicrobiae bacterium]
MDAQTTSTVAQNSGIAVWRDKAIEYVITHSGSLIAAIVVIIVGLLLARTLGKILDHWLERKAMEPPMRMLLVRIARLFVLAMALVVALSTAGFDMTALIAGIGVAGVGVGLALQGVLGNLVAGLTIIFTKPFRVGEWIEIAGVNGQVKTVELFATTLLHTDMSRVVIPNRKIVGEIMHNYGQIRQLDLAVGVAYGTNLNDAVTIARAVLSRNPRVLKEPVPVVGVALLADSSVNIAVKPWVKVDDFVAATAEVNQAIVEAFRAQKIEIPFPQREVRLLNGH